MLPRDTTKNKLVIAYKASPTPWPDGIGAWYRSQDWDNEGNLIATGDDYHRAMDYYANDRARGRPCPPIEGLGTPSSNDPKSESVAPIPSESIQSTKTDSPPGNSPTEAVALLLLAEGKSLRDVAVTTGLSVGKLQRLKAKS